MSLFSVVSSRWYWQERITFLYSGSVSFLLFKEEFVQSMIYSTGYSYFTLETIAHCYSDGGEVDE